MLDFLNSIVDFFNSILLFLHEKVYELLADFLVELSLYAIYSFFQVLIFIFQYVVPSALDAISSFNIVDSLLSSFGSLPPDLVNLLQFFNIPLVINILLAAYVVKFSLRFIPFIG